MKQIFAAFSTRQWQVISVLMVLAIISRFYQLGSIPHGMTWDEVAIGYNGQAILTTRRDEWLQKLPVSFRSYGDYKAPLAIYLNGISTFIWGMNSFGVRFPFAVAGVVFIVTFAWLVYELFHQSRYRKEITILALLFASASPWHWHYSRVGFESGLALSFVVLSLALITYVKNRVVSTISRKDLSLLALAAFLLVLSLYTYHSAKIFVPLLLLYLLFWLWPLIKNNLVSIAILGLSSVGLLVPLIRDSLYGPGATRAGVLITSQGYSASEFLARLISNLAAHLSPAFILFGQTDSLRHGTGYLGVLSITTVVLLLVALVLLVKNFSSVEEIKPTWLQLSLFAGVVALAGLVPAALSSEHIPHSNRALLALPGFLLYALVAVQLVLEKWQKKELIKRTFLGVIVMVEVLQALAFWHHYQTVFAKTSAADFLDGYVEAAQLAVDYERGENGKPQVDRVMMTSEYGQPYMFILFARQTSPIAYQGGSVSHKYDFVEKIATSDLDRKNYLLVAAPNPELPEKEADKIIYGSDGSVRFLVFYTGQ